MMKTLLYLLLLILNFQFSIFNSSAQVSFQKTIGGNTDDYGYCVIPTADGGYMLSGRTLSFGVGGYDHYLIKTDANGDTLWVKTYGEPGYEEAQSIQQTS